MAFQPGYKAHVLVDGVAGTPVNISMYHDNFSWPQNLESLDVSSFGSVAKVFIPGLSDSNISASGALDVALGTFVATLAAAHAAGSATSTVTYSPGGSVAGQLKISGEAYITNFTPSTGVGGRGEWSASLQVSGACTVATW